MKSFLKFGALLLSFGLILSVLGIMIIRTHAVPDQALKAQSMSTTNSTTNSATNSSILSSAPKS